MLTQRKARVFKVKEPTECPQIRGIKEKRNTSRQLLLTFQNSNDRKSSKLLERKVGLSTRIRLVTDCSSTTLTARKLGSNVC